jgi:hypothetical protein
MGEALISSIKILGRDINVVAVPDRDLQIMCESEACLGLFKDDTIYLASSLQGAVKMRVLKHEMIHAALTISGLANLLEEKLEEAIADCLENLEVPQL